MLLLCLKYPGPGEERGGGNGGIWYEFSEGHGWLGPVKKTSLGLELTSYKLLVYLGDFSTASGNYNGTGSYIWACGRKYQGNFVSGLPSGQGVLTFPQEIHISCI